jgi:hypothetical protein
MGATRLERPGWEMLAAEGGYTLAEATKLEAPRSRLGWGTLAAEGGYTLTAATAVARPERAGW